VKDLCIWLLLLIDLFSKKTNKTKNYGVTHRYIDQNSSWLNILPSLNSLDMITIDSLYTDIIILQDHTYLNKFSGN